MSNKVGKRVSVGLTTHIDRRSGKVELVKAKPIVQTIMKEYFDGRIQTNSGDIWQVKPVMTRNIDYIVVD